MRVFEFKKQKLQMHRSETELLAGAIAEGLLTSPGKTSIAVFTEGIPGARCFDFLGDFLKNSQVPSTKASRGELWSYHFVRVTPIPHDPHVHVFWLLYLAIVSLSLNMFIPSTEKIWTTGAASIQ